MAANDESHVDKQGISLEAWQADGQYFPHRGQRIFYRHARREGAPALLLIHGFPTASWDWNYLWEPLSTHFELLAPDLIGYGFSAKPADYAYSILDQADLCEELVLRHGATRYHILAHDYGDTVAQELLARAHDGSQRAELASVCFLNGGLFPEAHRPRLMQRLLQSALGPWIARRIDRPRFARSLKAVFGRQTPPSRKEIENFWLLLTEEDGVAALPHLIGYMEERRRYRARWVGALTKLPRRQLPLRLIDGADDPVSGRHMAARYRSLVPDADIVLLHGIGHYPQIEAPDAVQRAFLAFHRIDA